MPTTLLCIATYRKGDEFLQECRRQGCRVLLLTEEKLRDADWPRDAIDEFYYVRRDMPREDIRKGAALPRAHRAHRSHRRARRLRRRDGRDAARVPARAGHGRDDRRARFATSWPCACAPAPPASPARSSCTRSTTRRSRSGRRRVPPPWVLKPRGQAAAIGIRKLAIADELWRASTRSATRGRLRPRAVRAWRRVPRRFARVRSRPGRSRRPAATDTADGGRARGRHLRHADAVGRRPVATALAASSTPRVLHSFGLRPRRVAHGVHPRPRRPWHFLETSARVGGAYIVDVVEAATG